jgi:hypothetical protein
MTTPVYVTANGLVLPDYSTVLSEVEGSQKADVDPNLDVSPKSPIGQWNATMLATVRDGWEGVRIAYDGFNPNAAEDFLLAAVCQLTGTIKATATVSTLTATVSLDANKSFAAGTLTFAQEGDTGVFFTTSEDVVSTTAGDYPVKCQCTVTGPVTCNAGTLTVIQTPQSGLTAVTNAADAALGRNEDTDAQLRIRRQNELRASGNATVDAIFAKLEALRLADGSAPILECAVVENSSDYPDSLGRPPHCFECLIYDGDSPLTAEDDVYAQTIWDAHPAGIKPYGITDSGTAIDKQGKSRTVPFTRVTLRAIKITITIETSDNYGGDAAVKEYMRETFLEIRPKVGSTGVRSVKAAAFADVIDRGELGGVVGVVDVQNVQIGFYGGSYGAGGANLVLSARDMATLDTAHIEIVIA